MKLTRYFAGLALSITMLGGCYGGPGDTDMADTGETFDEARESRAWETLAGAWVGDTGIFRGLVLTHTTEGRGRHWFADVDTGVRCVRAPCPEASARVEGIYTATSRTITLTAVNPPRGFSIAELGTFNYTLRGEALRFTRGGRAVATLHKTVSYCGEADDCYEQRLITPRCLGRFTCTAESTCRYVCGRPTAGEGEMCGGIAAIPCADGLRCVLGGTHPDASGICRASTPSCATVRCAAGTHCELRPVTCVRAPCPPQPQCVPNVTTCAATTCAPGNVCEDTPMGARCVNPCATVRCASGTTCRVIDGRAQCVSTTGVRCGTITCAPGDVCCNPLRNICTPPGWACIQ
jgi:hypothetical protein